jgi:hypothetical protein
VANGEALAFWIAVPKLAKEVGEQMRVAEILDFIENCTNIFPINNALLAIIYGPDCQRRAGSNH